MKNKKIYTYFGIFLGIILIFFLSLQIFEIIYFNETYYKVPNFKSYTLEEANDIMKKTDLNIKDMGTELSPYPAMQIFMQEPAPGTIVKKGRNIRVWVSRGEALVDVPNLNNMNFLEAKVIAEKNGMKIGNVIYIKGNGEYNEVLATDPKTNTLLPKGQRISFLVNGMENVLEVKMPDIIGLSLEEGKNQIFKNSLSLGDIKYMKVQDIQPGIIIKTSINSESKIDAGTKIDIVVSE